MLSFVGRRHLQCFSRCEVKSILTLREAVLLRFAQHSFPPEKRLCPRDYPDTTVHVLLTIATISSLVFLMVTSRKATCLPLRMTRPSPRRSPLATGLKKLIFNSAVVASSPASSTDPIALPSSSSA